MRLSIKPVRALMLAFLLATSTIAWARSWVYYDARDPKSQFVLQRAPDRSAWLDIGGEATFCEKSSRMECFNAAGLRFAIPKILADDTIEWRHDGGSYRVVSKGRRRLLGRVYTIYLIDTELEQYQIRFIFSREAGLLGIATAKPKPGMFLLLDGSCGFGAPPSCRHATHQE